MIALWIILLALFLLLVFVLFSPFSLQVDTTTATFRLRWQGLASVRLTGAADDPVLRLWLLGWRKDLHLLQGASQPAKKKGKPAGESRKKKRSGKRPRWLTPRFGLRLLRTFRVHRFQLQLDTGDFVRNAYWYPIFHALSRGRRQLDINFQGHNELQLLISNRLGTLAWVFLSQILSTKRFTS